MSSRTLALTLLLLTLPCALAAPKAFVGSSTCGRCHPVQFQRQQSTHHAHALQPILESPIANLLTAQPIEDPVGRRFEYARSADGLTVAVTHDQSRETALLDWAFGAGAQGITPVGHTLNGYFEHRISWYSRVAHPALTLGQPAEASSALGQTQSAETISRCFGCHATGVGASLDLSSMTPGVQCERCHGPGRAHAAHPTRESILNPARAPAARVVEFCGQCHRMPQPSSVQPELDQPESVRFAPIGLAASRCFQASRTLSCLTCHDPHGNLETRASYYSEKCLACHSTTGASGGCGRSSKQDCVPCHMPRSSALPLLEFTDHRIRIVKPATDLQTRLLSSQAYDLSDPARAVAEAQAALDLDPRNEAAWLQLGQIFLSHNTPQPALEVFTEAQRIIPGSLLLQLGKGLAYKGLQRWDEAETELRACLQRNPRLAVAFDALAAVYLQLSAFPKLDTLALQFINASPSDYRGYYYLAAAREADKSDLKKAEGLVRRALQLNSNFAASYALLGKILQDQQRPADAISPLETAIRLRPDYTPAHNYLGTAYRTLGRLMDAKREFEIVRTLKEKEEIPPPQLRYHRGPAETPK